MSESVNREAERTFAGATLLDRIVSRLIGNGATSGESKSAWNTKMLIRVAQHHERQLQACDEMLTKQGVPEWVENSDSNGVPGSAVTCRLKWYLARRKDVKPEEAEPHLQAEMAANLAAAAAYRSNAPGERPHGKPKD